MPETKKNVINLKNKELLYVIVNEEKGVIADSASTTTPLIPYNRAVRPATFTTKPAATRHLNTLIKDAKHAVWWGTRYASANDSTEDDIEALEDSKAILAITEKCKVVKAQITTKITVYEEK